MVLSLLPSFGGCAATGAITLAKEDLTWLRGQPQVTVVQYPTPPFRAAGSEQHLLLPAVATAVVEQRAIAAGERVRMALSLKDPALRVQARFLATVAADLGLEQLRSARTRFLTADDVAELKQVLGAGVVLDFRTLHWGMGAGPKLIPFTTDRYAVGVLLRARLIHLDDERILWQVTCISAGRDPKARWTLEELTVNEGALLKEKLAEAVDACADDLAAKFQGRTSQGNP